MISRRRFLAGGSAVVGAAAAAAVVGMELGDDSTSTEAATSSSKGAEPFYGVHQGGVATAQQDRLLFASLDLTTTQRADVVQMLRDWTAAAAAMTAGNPVPP